MFLLEVSVSMDSPHKLPGEDRSRLMQRSIPTPPMTMAGHPRGDTLRGCFDFDYAVSPAGRTAIGVKSSCSSPVLQKASTRSDLTG
ncbi:hypothetical protein [Aurantiacibacter gilvus]|uniref:Uncharacterized protein n=1 Tax=Aurantiacibacter gilvus TaxID=3139141 RepID=A0ABU9IEQ2_9SPHN